jgi:AcrR family transcriptional regulator
MRAVELLANHLLETGLSQTSLRQLAMAAQTSDRMLIYYFGTKAEALSASTTLLASRIVAQLAEAVPGEERLSAPELARSALAVISSTQVRPFMRLWIAIVAAAARGEQPHVDIARQIMSGFQEWLEARVALQEESERQAAALAIIALCDGIMLVDLCAGEDASNRARSALALLA